MHRQALHRHRCRCRLCYRQLTGVSRVRDVEDLDAVVISTCNVGIVAGDGYRVCTIKFSIDTNVGVVYATDGDWVCRVRDVEDLDAVVNITCNVGIVAGDGYRVCTIKFSIDTDVGVVYASRQLTGLVGLEMSRIWTPLSSILAT